MISSAHISILSRPGGDTSNDDRAGGVCEPDHGHAWVIDGATGVTPDAFIPGADSDAAWLAGRLDACFADLPKSAAPVRVPVRRILGRVRDDYLLAIAGAAVPDFAVPSAAAMFCGWERCAHKVILRITELGDCVALLRDRDGRLHLVGGLTPGGGDADMLARFDAFHGARGEVSKREMWDFIKERRKLMNRPGGYWVFSISPETAGYLREHTFVLAPPIEMLLMTDGFSRLVDHFGAYTADSLIAAADQRGLEHLYRELRGLEAADPKREKAPRVKVEDDASAVFIHIPSLHPDWN